MSLSRFFSATKHIEYFSRLDKEAKILNSLLPLMISIARLRIDITSYLIRFLKISKLVEKRVDEELYLDSIDLLIVCGPADLEILPMAIKSSLQYSKNPISSITVITPKKCLDHVKNISEELSKGEEIEIDILNEDEYVNVEIQSQIKNLFGERYGWILQQLIKFKWTSESSSNAILVQDADTVFLQDFYSIETGGKQAIHYSAEFQADYFAFLGNLGLSLKKPIYSTVAHHQVIQPRFMREMMKKYGIQTPESLISQISDFQNLKQGKIVSIDYELYGQYMQENHPENLEYRKFCNISKTRSPESIKEMTDILSGAVESKYRSFSFHGYMGVKSDER